MRAEKRFHFSASRARAFPSAISLAGSPSEDASKERVRAVFCVRPIGKHSGRQGCGASCGGGALRRRRDRADGWRFGPGLRDQGEADGRRASSARPARRYQRRLCERRGPSPASGAANEPASPAASRRSSASASRPRRERRSDDRRYRAFATSLAPAHACVWARMAKHENGGTRDRQIMARFRAGLSVSIEMDGRRFDPVCARLSTALNCRSRCARDAAGFAERSGAMR